MNPSAPSTDPAAAAMGFVEAVVWGEHQLVWELLSPTGRLAVLEVAARSGLDVALAARLREGTAEVTERRRFLTDLVRGLRVDLREVDPDQVRCLAVAPSRSGHAALDEEPGAVRSRVRLEMPAAEGLGGYLPVGELQMSCHEGRWGVDGLRLLSWGPSAP